VFCCIVFFYVCRTKVNELSSEIGRFRTEIDAITQDQSSYVSYEKRYLTLHEHDMKNFVFVVRRSLSDGFNICCDHPESVQNNCLNLTPMLP